MEAMDRPSDLFEYSLSDGQTDLELLDRLLMEDAWSEFPYCYDILQAGNPNSMSNFSSSTKPPVFETSNNATDRNMLHMASQDEMEMSTLSTRSFSSERNYASQQMVVEEGICSVSSDDLDLRNINSESCMSWWVQSKEFDSSLKERFVHALEYIKDAQGDANVLVQLWVPKKRGEQLVLTTYSQPFALNSSCEKLVKYREISTNYEFSAQENSSKSLGLPGRVFVAKLPEWTPDVCYFSSFEYPRVNHAQRFDIRSTIALPVFDRDSQSCLGVVEVIMTTRKIKYSFELQNICNALQAVDLRSSNFLKVPLAKICDGSYQYALPEIREILQAVCKMHMLPLAQTWILCTQQCKSGSRHSAENYEDCVSTADEACYVNDPSVLGFHEACSEHHLFRGQGVAGQAFTTNQPCFSSDITAFSKAEYPLSHHARLFSLKGAVAIRLRSILTGASDFVLEFFLPHNCTGAKDQKKILDSLSSSLQNLSQTLRVVTTVELEDENMLKSKNIIPSQIMSAKHSVDGCPQNWDHTASAGCCPLGDTNEISSSVTGITESPEKEIMSILKFKQLGTEEPEFVNQIESPEIISRSEFGQQYQYLFSEQNNFKDGFCSNNSSSDVKKQLERNRKRTEKTVSFPDLQKHFAGSLKDAAKNLGVCPTTLKRICRQHGITRWPSRKIKKVDHSLKKLQLVIDSVHGADSAIQLSSLYKDFATNGSHKNSSRTSPTSSINQTNHPRFRDSWQDATFNYLDTSSSQSSLTCSPSHYSSCMEKHPAENDENLTSIPLASVNEDIGILAESKKCQTIHGSNESLDAHCSNACLIPLDKNDGSHIRIKAVLGSEIVRFRVHSFMSFQDLKREILRRFNIDDMSTVDLKYLDDDSEWVLLTCDADLQECIEVYSSYGSQTIRLSVQKIDQASNRSFLHH